DLGPAVILAEAAQLALDDEASAGLRAWIAGERAAQEAELGQELAAGHHLERAYRVSAAASAAEMNLFSDLDSTWLEQYRGGAALSLVHADEAIEVFTAVLEGTDAGLPWERARALYRLAWAWALKGEAERACELLLRAVELTRGNGDRRGLALAVQVRNRHLGASRTDPYVRDLDEAIRAAQRA